MAHDKPTEQRNSERRIERRMNPEHDRLPGQRGDLPEGTLRPQPTDPQGDENRTPPANAPTLPE